MWIVRVALQRPYTFIMLAVLIVLMGGYAMLNTATDIFPNIKIPIAAVIWRYNGILPGGDREPHRPVLRACRTNHGQRRGTHRVAVGPRHLGGQVLLSTRTSIRICRCRRSRRSRRCSCAFSPPGTTSPFVLSYNASTVPILQLALTSPTLPEAQIYDLANTILRTQLATVAGASIPYPFGGKQRQVQVDLDPQALQGEWPVRRTMWSRPSAPRI